MSRLRREQVLPQDSAADEPPANSPVGVVTVFEFPNRLTQGVFLLLLARLRGIARKHQCRPLLMTRGRMRGRRTVLLSLWESDEALIGFSGDLPHVQVVRWCIREGVQVWSGVFDCRGTSSLSRTWFGPRRQWLPK